MAPSFAAVPPGGPIPAVRDVAFALLEGFDKHYRLFRETSARAKERFETAAWSDGQRAVQERIRFYDDRVRECVERLRAEFDVESFAVETWQGVKLFYIGLLVDHHQPELAETFFNSVITRILRRTYADNDLIFVRAAISTEQIESDPPIYRSYYPNEDGLRESFLRVFADYGWRRPFGDLGRDVDLLLAALELSPAGAWEHLEPNHQIQVLWSALYRNKGAYVLGKIVNGHAEVPFAVPVLHDAGGRLCLDAVIFDPERINVLFSLSRAYFMVEMAVPSGYVAFLRTMVPMRARSELYTVLGLGKQGKTLFFRDFLHHLHHSEDMFVEAPGIRGKVMLVFTLPSYPYVFKVIKDVFGSGKEMSREQVREKFAMVKQVDRIGRMADTLEFTELALPRARFSPELLDQLHQLAPSMIEDGESITIRHCYVERRLSPLNMLIDRAHEDELEAIVREYGNAIRELAIANVFPGDMLWRNFGVARDGRVVFYDYDEIEYLTDIRFRRIPPPPNPEAELSAEPWYAVQPLDVFPEEFATFLLSDPRVREPFVRHHADLLMPEFWQECQRRILEGEIVDFFPYPETLRFAKNS